MEDSLFEDIIDDWFIESLKTYKDLHVYQLEHPTQVIEWTSGKSVCVAGNTSSRNEILELRLPLKLFAEEKKGLCAERDFKVIHGGFSDGPVRRLTHVPGTRILVTNDGLSSDLQLWERGADDSDVVRRTGGIEGRRNVSQTGSRIAAATLSSGQQVLHGSQSDDIVLCDITSGRTVYTIDVSSSDPVSALQCVSDGVFMVCCSNGKVYLSDTRSPAPPLLSAAPQATDRDVLWWGHASAGQAQTYQDCRLIRLSSLGQAVITDLRDLQRGVCGAQLEAQNQLCSLDTVCVTWAPALDDCVAVSGLSGSVQIYNTSVWSSDQQQDVQQPMFQHRGHTVTSHSNHLSSNPSNHLSSNPSNHLSSQQHSNQESTQNSNQLSSHPSNHLSSQPSNRILVTAHAWHPSRPCTLLSAASDGSVHVWDWIDQSHASK